jgi:hypothetical protein
VTSFGLVGVQRCLGGPSASILRTYTSTLLTEATRSFETSVDFYRTTRRYVSEENTIQKYFLHSIKDWILCLESYASWSLYSTAFRASYVYTGAVRRVESLLRERFVPLYTRVHTSIFICECAFLRGLLFMSLINFDLTYDYVTAQVLERKCRSACEV